MCGIFGYVGQRDDTPTLVLEGLRRLEYRGYDSWGIAVKRNGTALVEKHVGKIGQASTSLPASTIGLGHTRWATHGGITTLNAHPHLDCSGRLALIHNGIVENFAELRQALRARGHVFRSETDTEVVAHLLEDELRGAAGTREALRLATMATFRQLEGLNAIAVLDVQTSTLVAAKNGSPLVLGWGDDGVFLASDASALLEHTRRLSFLADDQLALLASDGAWLYDVRSGEELRPAIREIAWEQQDGGLAGYQHYMLKEIREQPRVLRRIAREGQAQAQTLADLVLDAHGTYLIGCGTAANAALSGKYLFSRIAARQVSFATASEFAYTEHYLNERSLVVALSQSGETIDVLETVRAARERGAYLAALVNVEGSSLYRLADCPILLGAGPERCVLATKSFTAKLAYLLLAAYAAAGRIEQGVRLVERAADEIEAFLDDPRAAQVAELAQRLYRKEHLYLIGRGPSYPLALEAALKIKEVSYIHAEGFAGGELKHGVIALIEADTPCIVFAPRDETQRAIISGAMEVKARGGCIIGLGPDAHEAFDHHVPLADVGDASVIVNAVPPQLLAYHLCLLRGYDPDKPRNLAKSVTVK